MGEPRADLPDGFGEVEPVARGRASEPAVETLRVANDWCASTPTPRARRPGPWPVCCCGAAAIPPQWTEPFEDRVRSAVFGFDGVKITELASRTLRLVS